MKKVGHVICNQFCHSAGYSAMWIRNVGGKAGTHLFVTAYIFIQALPEHVDDNQRDDSKRTPSRP